MAPLRRADGRCRCPFIRGRADSPRTAFQFRVCPWLCENSKNRETTRIIFRNQLQPNKPTKFRRPKTTLGGMLILASTDGRAILCLRNENPPKRSGDIITEENHGGNT